MILTLLSDEYQVQVFRAWSSKAVNDDVECLMSTYHLVQIISVATRQKERD